MKILVVFKIKVWIYLSGAGSCIDLEYGGTSCCSLCNIKGKPSATAVTGSSALPAYDCGSAPLRRTGSKKKRKKLRHGENMHTAYRKPPAHLSIEPRTFSLGGSRANHLTHSPFCCTCVRCKVYDQGPAWEATVGVWLKCAVYNTVSSSNWAGRISMTPLQQCEVVLWSAFVSLLPFSGHIEPPLASIVAAVGRIVSLCEPPDWIGEEDGI